MKTRWFPFGLRIGFPCLRCGGSRAANTAITKEQPSSDSRVSSPPRGTCAVRVTRNRGSAPNPAGAHSRPGPCLVGRAKPCPTYLPGTLSRVSLRENPESSLVGSDARDPQMPCRREVCQDITSNHYSHASAQTWNQPDRHTRADCSTRKLIGAIRPDTSGPRPDRVTARHSLSHGVTRIRDQSQIVTGGSR